MALSCIICQIKRDIGGKSWFFHTPLHSAPPLGGPHRKIAVPFCVGKLEWWGYPMVKELWRYVFPFRLNIGVWQTDGRTDGHLATAMRMRRAVKRKTVQRSNLGDRLPTSGAAGGAVLRSYRLKVKVTGSGKGRASYRVGYWSKPACYYCYWHTDLNPMLVSTSLLNNYNGQIFIISAVMCTSSQC